MKKIFARATNFFREDLDDVIGAYFDGTQIFIARLTENFETVTVDAETDDFNHVAEKISRTCRQRGWRTSAVGFCLRDDAAVTYQTDVDNLPAKEIPAYVRSWAVAQAGKDAAFAFADVDGGLWMETLPRATFDDICAAFDNCNLKLRALSLMPTDLLTKTTPAHHAEFIADIVRRRKSPNLLARSSAVDRKKISAATVAIFFIAAIVAGANLFSHYSTATRNLNAAKTSLDDRRDDFVLKDALTVDSAELNRLNKLVATLPVTSTQFNTLMNLGKVVADDVSLNTIRADNDAVEITGAAEDSDAVKNFLGRVKNSVAANARLEHSAELDDGTISFTIRATP